MQDQYGRCIHNLNVLKLVAKNSQKGEGKGCKSYDAEDDDETSWLIAKTIH